MREVSRVSTEGYWFDFIAAISFVFHPHACVCVCMRVVYLNATSRYMYSTSPRGTQRPSAVLVDASVIVVAASVVDVHFVAVVCVCVGAHYKFYHLMYRR